MPESKFPKLEVLRKIGSEEFHAGSSASRFDLLDFWRWSASDLVNNPIRGVLGEYIVDRAVGGSGAGIRDPWATFDITTPAGIRLEVKSASYVQSWAQDRLSSISFRIPETFAWDPESGDFETESRRQADVYVFAVMAHEGQSYRRSNGLGAMGVLRAVDQGVIQTLRIPEDGRIVPVEVARLARCVLRSRFGGQIEDKQWKPLQQIGFGWSRPNAGQARSRSTERAAARAVASDCGAVSIPAYP